MCCHGFVGRNRSSHRNFQPVSHFLAGTSTASGEYFNSLTPRLESASEYTFTQATDVSHLIWSWRTRDQSNGQLEPNSTIHQLSTPKQLILTPRTWMITDHRSPTTYLDINQSLKIVNFCELLHQYIGELVLSSHRLVHAPLDKTQQNVHLRKHLIRTDDNSQAHHTRQERTKRLFFSPCPYVHRPSFGLSHATVSRIIAFPDLCWTAKDAESSNLDRPVPSHGPLVVDHLDASKTLHPADPSVPPPIIPSFE